MLSGSFSRKKVETVNDAITQILSVCSLITAIGAVIALAVQAAKKVQAPNELQNQRIAACEGRLTEVEKKLAKDLDRFEEIEAGTAIIMTAILALLSHGIDGNDVQSMKEAKEELQAFLIKGRIKKGGRA